MVYGGNILALRESGPRAAGSPEGAEHISPGQSDAATAAKRRPGYCSRFRTKPCKGETNRHVAELALRFVRV